MKYLFANWKMYLSAEESVRCAQELVTSASAPSGVEVAVFPNTLAFAQVRWALSNKGIKIGGQNCSWTPRGAYTGATSAHLFAEAGADYMLVGHSERRHIFGEKDSDIRKKFEACLDAGIVPVLCIGETAEEREAGKREYRLKKQLFTALDQLQLAGKRIMVAYEPVWAIGSGEACAPLDADDVHGWIRQELQTYTTESVPVLYGGSVDEKNVASYAALATVDGVLVGTASVAAAGLQALAEAIRSSSKNV